MQSAIRSAWMFNAGRVIAIDCVAQRLQMARDANTETIDFKKEKLSNTREITSGFWVLPLAA